MDHGTRTKSLSVAESHSGNRTSKDQEVWRRLEELFATQQHPMRHVLELWPAYVRRVHMARFLAHYELFKHAIDLPGCVVEAGVYRGPSLLTWGKLMETFCPGDRSRKVYGFDSFEGLTDFTDRDGKKDPAVGKTEGGWSAGAVEAEVRELVEIANLDNFVSGNERIKLVKCRLTEESLESWLQENPGLRISLLHLDVDLYAPTLAVLRKLYPRVVNGGVVIFDEYGLMPWEGESNAVDQYFAELGITPRIRKNPIFHNPHGYIIKNE